MQYDNVIFASNIHLRHQQHYLQQNMKKKNYQTNTLDLTDKLHSYAHKNRILRKRAM